MFEEINNEAEGYEEFQRLAESNPWWKQVFEEFSRAIVNCDFAYQLPPEQILELSNVILELTSIREEDIKRSKDNQVFSEARAIIEKLKLGDPFPDRLAELYESRRIEALTQIIEQGANLISLLSDEAARDQVKDMWDNNRPELPSLSEELLGRLDIRDLNQRHILRSICELALVEKRLLNRRNYPFSSRVYMPATFGEKGDRNRVNYLAYRVYDPLWNDLMERFDIEYITFPLKWAGSVLPVALMRKLQENHKAGKDILGDLLDYYRQETNLEDLTERIANCPCTSMFSGLFGEIVEVFRDGQYRICSLALLSLTEGLLWAFAKLWNNIHGSIFDSAITDEEYEELEFHLLKRDGTQIGGRPNIGKLLRHTTFGDAISHDFVEYYCQELFNERNPVLHGKVPEYGDGKKAAMLLFLVNAIEHRILDAVKSITREEVSKVIKVHKKSKGA